MEIYKFNRTINLHEAPIYGDRFGKKFKIIDMAYSHGGVVAIEVGLEHKLENAVIIPFIVLLVEFKQIPSRGPLYYDRKANKHLTLVSNTDIGFVFSPIVNGETVYNEFITMDSLKVYQAIAAEELIQIGGIK